MLLFELLTLCFFSLGFSVKVNLRKTNQAQNNWNYGGVKGEGTNGQTREMSSKKNNNNFRLVWFFLMFSGQILTKFISILLFFFFYSTSKTIWGRFTVQCCHLSDTDAGAERPVSWLVSGCSVFFYFRFSFLRIYI